MLPLANLTLKANPREALSENAMPNYRLKHKCSGFLSLTVISMRIYYLN